MAARAVSRRSVVKLAYATPLIAASFALRPPGAGAIRGTCDCYDPALGFGPTNIGGACHDDGPLVCGQCASCSPLAGAACPDGARLLGGQLPACSVFDTVPDCRPVFRPICEALVSPV